MSEQQVEETKAEPLRHCPRKTEEELKVFVRDYCDGKIFTDRMLSSPCDARMVFLAFTMAISAGQFAEEFFDEVGLIYEYLDKAGPMAVNGNPSFFSTQFMHKEDWERAPPAISAELERRKNITI